MTDIYVYCPICNKKDGGETLSKSMTVVNGQVTFLLKCNHVVRDNFKC